MNFAVIGAGAAGICAAKQALANGFKVIVYEQTKQIGGTWVYTDKVGIGDYGLQIHTSMYLGLHTNSPKEVMGYPDFDFPDLLESFVASDVVLQYLNNYAQKFNVIDHIKFEHYVLSVKPFGTSQWEVTVKDLPNDKSETCIFDAVIVCNGHYSVPHIPNYIGKELYRGKQIHSHAYRNSEHLRDENVLIIGTGLSALDISFDLENVVKSLTISHHQVKSLAKFPENTQIRPDVKKLTEYGAEFVDGSHENFTAIFYCTGYHYKYPFLSEDCGTHVDDNYVRPLYKQCINIIHPTMAFIGLPFVSCQFQMFDLQVRFFMKYYTNQNQLPSKEYMLNDTETIMQKRWDVGFKKKQAHLLGPLFMQQYLDDLSETAEIDKIKPVIGKLYLENRLKSAIDYGNLKKQVYTIIDDETFLLKT